MSGRWMILVALLGAGPLGAQEGAPSFAGVVRLPDGKPAAGAQLWLVAMDFEHPGSPAVTSQTAADGQGRFRLTGDPAQTGNLVYYNVCARAPGRAFAWSGNLRNSDLDLTLNLAPPFPLRGRVTDSAGQPVAGVQPKLSTLNSLAGFDPLAFRFLGATLYPPQEISDLMVSPTNAQGEYTVRGLPAGVDIHLHFKTPAYASRYLGRDWAELMKGEPLDVVLPPPGTIRGTVLTAAGTPASGLSVSGGGLATTDAQGHYAITGLAAGVQEVYLNELPVEYTAPAHLDVKVEAGATVEGVDFRLERGMEITGRVTEARTGTPVANVGICCNTAQQPQMGTAWPVVYTGADGRYTLRAPAGGAQVRPLYLPRGWHSSGPVGGERAQFTVAAGQTSYTANFSLVREAPGGGLRGTVVDAAGQPVPGARVLCLPNGDAFTVSANEQGEFRVPLSAGATANLAAYSGEAMTTALTPVTGTQTGPVTLRLTPGTRPALKGSVASDDGKPLAYAIVRADTRLPRLEQSGGRGGYLQPFLSSTVLTDAQGRFVLRKLLPGIANTLRVRAGGYAEKVLETQALEAGERQELDTIVLASANVVITGVVLDAKDQPVAGAEIEASPLRVPFSRRMTAITDTAGRFRIAGLPREPLRISADQFEFEGTRVTTAGGSQEVTLRVIRRREQVLYTYQLNPPVSAEVGGMRVTLTALVRFRGLAPTGEIADFLAPEATFQNLGQGRARPQLAFVDEQGLPLARGGVLRVEGEYRQGYALPAAGAKALGEVRLLAAAQARTAPLLSRGPLALKTPLADPGLVLWAVSWEQESLKPGPTGAAAPPPPYLAARVYALCGPGVSWRVYTAQADPGALALAAVAGWTYNPATDELVLPEELQAREAELRQEAKEAWAALKPLATPGAATTVQGLGLQSAGGHADLALPQSVTVRVQALGGTPAGEALVKNLAIPPELTAGVKF